MLQLLEVENEKLNQSADVNPFAITQPVAFTEEMLSKSHWSPTARIYLQEYRLVNEGLQILRNSKFTDGRGISLIAQGYLTENSILQAFPVIRLPHIFHLCEENLKKNPCFFEGLVLPFALGCSERKISIKSAKADAKKLMGVKNLIHLIQKAEPNSLPSEDPFEFGKNSGSWLHVLYYHLGSLYTINEATEQATDAFENSLKHSCSRFEGVSERGCTML